MLECWNTGIICFGIFLYVGMWNVK